MSLKALETEWKTALISILEQLTPPQLRKLLFKLDKIPQGLRTEKHMEELPDLIIQHYGAEGSISVIDKEMKVLPRNDASVQEPLSRFVEKVKQLKKQRQEAKEKEKQPATASGSVKKPKPAAGTSKPESASGSVKPKPANGTTSKPASSSAAKTPKPASGQPKSCQPDEVPSAAVQVPSAAVQVPSAAVQVPSAAVQTGRIRVKGILSSNTRNTHLEVELNGPQKFYATTRLLADAVGLKAEEGFEAAFSRLMPLSADATIQGKKILEIKKLSQKK